jgi:hypothetical protein
VLCGFILQQNLNRAVRLSFLPTHFVVTSSFIFILEIWVANSAMESRMLLGIIQQGVKTVMAKVP